MKKINLLLLMLVLFTLFGCNDETKPTSIDKTVSTETNSKEVFMINESLDAITLDNELIKLVINPDNGSLVSFVNKETGRDLIEGSVGGNWSFYVDTATNDYYQVNLKASTTKRVTSRTQAPTYKIIRDAEKEILELTFDVSFKNGTTNYTGIKVVNTFTILKATKEINVDYQVINNLEIDSVIVNFTSLILSGIKDSESTLNLFWPNKEGKIYNGAVKKAFSTLKLSEQYPSPVSMQLMQLYDENDSFYYYVKDSSREYKELNFGAFVSSSEFDNGVGIKDKISLSCTQYPFIAKGEAKDLWTTVIGVDVNREWYSGADSYRNFLISAKMNRDYNDYVQTWTGFVSTKLNSFGDILHSDYISSGSPDKVVASADSSGIDTIVLFGWHEGGFDSRYPDYTFIEGENYGAENFKKMVDNAHKNGDKVLPYLNAHITALNSEWGNTVIDESSNLTNIDNSALKKMGFNRDLAIKDYRNYMYYETYGTETGYYATCPSSDEFIKQIGVVVERLAAAGVDGLWMDQMMEMPAYMCFDSSHNHKTPATAYGEGYAKMYGLIDEIFANHNIEYLIFAEGTTDAWIEYIDVCGYMWARKLGAPDNVNPGDGVNMSPNLSMYTIPAKFLGIDSYDTNYNHAHAFLYASPLKGASSKDSEVIALWKSNEDIYFNGRYMDTLGLDFQNDNVLASVIKGVNNCLGIQIYNNSSKEQTIFIEIDLNELNIEGEISLITNLFTGENINIVNNKINVKVAPNDIVALKVSYQ